MEKIPSILRGHIWNLQWNTCPHSLQSSVANLCVNWLWLYTHMLKFVQPGKMWTQAYCIERLQWHHFCTLDERVIFHTLIFLEYFHYQPSFRTIPHYFPYNTFPEILESIGTERRLIIYFSLERISHGMLRLSSSGMTKSIARCTYVCSDLYHAEKLIDFMTSRAAAPYAHADGILKLLCSACYNNYC